MDPRDAAGNGNRLFWESSPRTTDQELFLHMIMLTQGPTEVN